eukprot:m.146195 g.146195  ORF g.146195 m.146195 type:complete len:375 (+) comp23094_c0_seq5:16-1140(+)
MIRFVIGLTVAVVGSGHAASGHPDQPRTQRSLPHGNLILGYAEGCGDHVLLEAELGVNVINWFAANLAVVEGTPTVQHQLNLSCVAWVAAELRRKQLPTAHILSIGGWNAPHVDTTLHGAEWWALFEKWNRETVARDGFAGFDGFDWDLEGNDAVASQWNHFSIAGLTAVGEMSQAAKDAGYIVTMVPPESYLDPTTSAFDLSLLHAYPEWHPEFKYHGHNCYAALLAKWGTTKDGHRTFDLVDIQLYETYAHAAFQLEVKMVPPADYLVAWINQTLTPWVVDFASLPALAIPSQPVIITPDQLIVGFSMGGASGKSVYIHPDDVGVAWSRLPKNRRPRGTMFWNMEIDGGAANGTAVNVSLVRGFNKFLRTRQ